MSADRSIVMASALIPEIAEEHAIAMFMRYPALLAKHPELGVTHFGDPKAALVFHLMRNVEAAGKEITVDSVLEQAEHEERTGPLLWAGGGERSYLVKILAGIPPLISIEAAEQRLEKFVALIIQRAADRASYVEQGEEQLRTEHEIDEFALRDAEAEPAAGEKPKPAPPKRIGRSWEQCVEEIYARKDEPWIDIRIGTTVIATCRNGSFVPLVAPSGAGKSALALQMLVDFAIHFGPAIYVTYELDGDEAVARAIGQQCSFSWPAVLRGEVPRDMVPSVSRLTVLEREEATLPLLEKAITQARAEFPGQPIFVVVDYMQATPAPPGKERGHTANVSADLRRSAKKNRVVLVGVSQASTENSRKMRHGELLGLDAAATGAETSQIERDAYVILALGDRKQIDPETVSWKLSTAKYRMGTPDVVHELHYRGRIGTWEVVSDAISASDVREQKRDEAQQQKRKEKDPAKDDQILLARISKLNAEGKRNLCTERQLRSGNGISKERAELALERLVNTGRARLVTIAREQKVGRNRGTTTVEVYEPVEQPGMPAGDPRGGWSWAERQEDL